MIAPIVPDPLYSDRQYARFHNLDLLGCEDTELLDELSTLRPLLFGLPAAHWLRQRVGAIESELKRRRYRQPEFKAPPKPRHAEGVRL
jgi:hypothetical protein